MSQNLLAAALAGMIATLPLAAKAQSAADFYKGRTVTMLICSATSGDVAAATSSAASNEGPRSRKAPKPMASTGIWLVIVGA